MSKRMHSSSDDSYSNISSNQDDETIQSDEQDIDNDLDTARATSCFPAPQPPPVPSAAVAEKDKKLKTTKVPGRFGLSTERQKLLCIEWWEVRDLPGSRRLKSVILKGQYKLKSAEEKKQAARLFTRWNKDISIFHRYVKNLGIPSFQEDPPEEKQDSPSKPKISTPSEEGQEDEQEDTETSEMYRTPPRAPHTRSRGVAIKNPPASLRKPSSPQKMTPVVAGNSDGSDGKYKYPTDISEEYAGMFSCV